MSKFERAEDIKLTSHDDDLKKRLEKELMNKERLNEQDASFKAMVDIED